MPFANDWTARLLARGRNLPCAFRIHTAEGVATAGEGTPEFDVHVHNDRGMRALRSLSELKIADAYVRGDIDIEGDCTKAMWLRDFLSDRSFFLQIWRRVQPLIMGRERLNPGWIQKHYDSKNAQLLALDQDYYAYTPGIYESDEETLEQSSQRKYDFAWSSLGLKEGDELLEVGCGWGGMTRYCASRGVRVTGITLSHDQHAFTDGVIEKHGLGELAKIHYQDFFTFHPGRKFDAISCMGVIEDLSDYPRVMKRFAELLKPGARAYLDFAAENETFGTSTFITKYVWPGTFRMVNMPELMTAVERSRMRLVALWNDRRNYYLWARNGHARWVENQARVVEQAGVEIYRLFRLLFMGTAGVMSNPKEDVTAYRMLLEAH